MTYNVPMNSMAFQAYFDLGPWRNIVEGITNGIVQKESTPYVENWRSYDLQKLRKSHLKIGQISLSPQMTYNVSKRLMILQA